MIIDSPIISGSHAASGSLNQTGDVVITGSLTVTGTINASITGSITSASYATNAETLDGLDSTSFTTTSSFNTASSSFSTRVTDLETASGSFSTRVTNNESTGSSLTTASGSFSTRVTNTEATASSLVTASGSFSTRTTNLETASGSFSTRVTSAEGSVSSLNNKSGSYATTGSNNFNGNQVITGSLTTTGQIIAQTLNVQQVTSSIVYSSGSNIFGNSVSNTQQFTGSLQVSGSTHYLLGNVGIGTTSPATIVHLQQSSGPTIRLVRSSNRFDITGDTDFMELNARDASTYMIFKTADIERIRITSGGDIAVGSTSTRLSGGSTNSTFLTLTAKASGANALLELNGIRTGNGDYSGYVRFFNNSGATPVADIQAIRGSSDVSGSLAIATSGTERMRITSTGEVGIGVTPTAGNAFWVKGRSTSSGDTAILAQNSDGTNLFYVLNNGTVIMPNGNVGIGTTNVPFGLSVYRASIGQGDTSTNLLLFDTTSYTTGVGGGISFGGYYDSSNSEIYTYGYIKGGKENSTNGNFSGYLSFGTRAQSAGSSAERMRITSGGNILLGTSSEYGPGFKLQINGSAYITGIVYSNSGFYINSGQYTGITEAPYTGIYMTNSSSGDGFGALLVTSRTDVARPIIFGTSNGSTSVERMRISSGGNIGIGTTSPITKLSLGGYNGARLPYIVGTSYTFDASGITVPSSNNANAAIGGGIDLTNNTYSVGAFSPIISFSSLSSNSAYNNAYAGIWGVLGGQGVDANWVVGHLAFGTGNGAGITERMRIASNGDVGVGTSSPAYKLDVNGTIYAAGGGFSGPDGSTGYRIKMYDNGGVHNDPGIGLDGSGGAGEIMWFNAYNGFYFNYGTGGVKVKFDSSGRVGIGTTSPNRLLTVASDTSFYNGADSAGAIDPGAHEVITTGFNVVGQSSLDISNIGITLNKWKAIIRGGFANNNEGGGLTSSGLEIEVDSNNPSIPVGSSSLTFSRNSSTGKLQVTCNLPSNLRITFVGTIHIINYPQSVLPTVSKIILGKVGIGTTSPSDNLHIAASETGNVGISVQNTNASYSAQLRFLNSAGTEKSALTYVQSNDSFVIANNSQNIMTITSGGKINITNNLSDYGLTVVNSNASSYGVYIQAGGTYNLIDGYNYTGGTALFRVNGAGTIFAVNTTVQSISDVRTKENITTSTDGLNIINSLRPVRFDFKEGFGNNKKNQLGFIAQEVENIFPDIVDSWKNKPNDEIEYKTLGPTGLIPVLVKAIQELKQQNDVLLARIEQLENK